MAKMLNDIWESLPRSERYHQLALNWWNHKGLTDEDRANILRMLYVMHLQDHPDDAQVWKQINLSEHAAMKIVFQKYVAPYQSEKLGIPPGAYWNPDLEQSLKYAQAVFSLWSDLGKLAKDTWEKTKHTAAKLYYWAKETAEEILGLGRLLLFGVVAYLISKSIGGK